MADWQKFRITISPISPTAVDRGLEAHLTSYANFKKYTKKEILDKALDILRNWVKGLGYSLNMDWVEVEAGTQFFDKFKTVAEEDEDTVEIPIDLDLFDHGVLRFEHKNLIRIGKWWLKEHPDIERIGASDLARGGIKKRGRKRAGIGVGQKKLG